MRVETASLRFSQKL